MQVGYHNEHHDFPSIPWTRLPALRQLAKDFYEPLPSHKSWPYVTWKFITDPNIGMWCRAKRLEAGEKIDVKTWNQVFPLDSGSDSEAASAADVEKEMAEVVERGYASDRE